MHKALIVQLEGIYSNKNYYTDIFLQSLVDEENFIQIKDLSNHNRIKNFFEEAGFDMSKKAKMQFTMMKVVRDKIESVNGKRGLSALT